MWYFILALLFGNPSNSNTSNDQTVVSAQSDDNDPKTGGDNGPIRPK
ncbi:hypothetical protein OKW96_12330 [Sphingobacterium sp. KU25419]|nr:hypothetical protein OKW96_12330 [Sphingobacterium sp. KU25419]